MYLVVEHFAMTTMWLVVSFAMYANEYVNVNVIGHMNCVRYVLYLIPMYCTMGIHSIEQILMLTALLHTLMVELVLMVTLILYIYDILDYCKIKTKFQLFKSFRKKRLYSFFHTFYIFHLRIFHVKVFLTKIILSML